MPEPYSPAEVADRLAITDLLTRYATMVDFRRWELMDQVWAPGATADYTSPGGKAGDAREVMRWLDGALTEWPINLHCISNVDVRIDGDRASSFCYYYAPMVRSTGDASFHVINNAGQYDDRLVRTADGWRIEHRTCLMTFMDGSLPEGYEIPQ